MKRNLFALGGCFFLLCITACNNGESTTTTDSSTVTTATGVTGPEDVSASQNISVQLDPAVSYVDLKTGKQVKLRIDTVTKYIVNEVSNEPVTYYINPSTNDTFDRRGRLVSRALVRTGDGDYTVDESRITITSDDNTNADTSNTISSDGTTGTVTGNSKTKIKDDKFKQKTDTTSIKVKEGKIKVKTQ